MLNNLYFPKVDSDEKNRIFYFDNLKFLLILLVVIGHFINPLKSEIDSYKGLYMFIYTFHMPLFIYATGYFAKSVVDKDLGRFKTEKIIQFFILYLFMTLVIFAINYFLTGTSKEYYLFKTSSPAWYLLATMVWYALIPLIRNVRPVYVFSFSILLSLYIGYDSTVGDFLSLSRIICFFPFFIAGYYMSQEQVEKILNFGGMKIRWLSFAFLIGFLVLCIVDPFDYYSIRQIVSPHYAYESISKFGDMYNIVGPIVRFFWFGVAGAVSVVFMWIVPRKKMFFTIFGARTLQVYIWHAILIRLMNYFGFSDWVIASGNDLVILIPLIIAVAVTFILSWKPIGTPFNWLLSKKFDFIFRKDKSAGTP